MTEPAYVSETLAWCNARRAEKGLEPLDRLPKGHRGDPDESCPCGKATGLSVTPFDFYADSQQTKYVGELPDHVAEFVEAFDDGELPQYDEDLA